MLKQRVLTACILAPATIAGVVFLPLPFFIIAITALVLGGFWEWRNFILTDAKKTVFAAATTLTLASLFMLPITEFGNNWSASFGAHIAVSIGGLWWLFIIGMLKPYPKRIGWWEKNALWQQVFSWLTLLPFLWSVFLLRAYHYSVDSLFGAKLVLLVCLLVWAADSGAFFAGKAFGKRKMAPNVSPNKTVAGLIGGLLAAVAAMFIAAHYFAIPFSSFPIMCLIALVTALASVIGDLAESMFKRVAGVKDSGHILPGHGGILDRIDSLTAAFPVFTLLYFGLAQ